MRVLHLQTMPREARRCNAVEWLQVCDWEVACHVQPLRLAHCLARELLDAAFPKPTKESGRKRTLRPSCHWKVMMPGRSILLLLAAQSATAPVQLTTDDRDLVSFEAQARAAARSKDHHDLLKLVDLPLRVNSGGWPVRTRYYRTAKSIEQDFARIFASQILRSMRFGNYELVGSGKGTVGSGAVWFMRPCHTRVCEPDGPGSFRISVVNLGP